MRDDFYDHHEHVFMFVQKFNLAYPELIDRSIEEKFEIYTKAHPDYDCWAQLVYYFENGVVFSPEGVRLSMRGMVVSPLKRLNRPIHERKNGMVLREGAKRQSGYPKITIGDSGLLMHRLIASTFIKRPDHLKHIPFMLLHVNHKNGIKNDYRPNNLEWSTPKENAIHSSMTGLSPQGLSHTKTISVLGIFSLPGKWFGKTISFSGNKEINSAELFSQTEIHEKVREGGLYKGFKWIAVSEEEYNRHSHCLEDPEFKKFIDEGGNTYLDERTNFLIGTVIHECAYKGLQFIIFGETMIEHNGFPANRLMGFYKSKESDSYLSKGCLFVRGGLRDLEKFPRGIPDGLVKILSRETGNKFHPVIANKDGEDMLFASKEELSANGFIYKEVKKNIRGETGSHRGSKFRWAERLSGSFQPSD